MRTEIDAIRQATAASGNHSNTSTQFQDDLLRYGESFAEHGNCLIEVGCYRGGMSAQFAALGKRCGQTVHVIDIHAGYLSVARDTVRDTGNEGHAEFHLMDFPSFAAAAGPEVRPSLVLIDGDHFYNGVVADILALYAMKSLPYAAAFHDYSLRYSHAEGADIRVDRAIHDTLGADFDHVAIGDIAREGGSMRTVPGADHHFHEAGQSEGVLILCGRTAVRRPDARGRAG